jgi:putative membrane protein
MTKPTIAQAFALCVAALLLGVAFAFAPTDGRSPLMSISALALFAWPAWRAASAWLGWKRATVAWACLGGLGLLLESNAIATGFPYGFFAYSDLLGPRFLDLAPYALVLSWPPIVLVGLAAARLWRHDRQDLFATVTFAAAAMMAVDLVIEPATIGLGFWAWQVPGGWYGMPIINSVGWGMTGALGAVVAHEFADTKGAPGRSPRLMALYGVAYLLFWTGANLGLSHWAAALAGLVVATTLWRLAWHTHAPVAATAKAE